MKNEYEVRGDVTAIFINSPKYGMKEALISTNKLERVKEFPNSWCLVWGGKTKSFYVRGAFKGKGIRLHRWVSDAPDKMDVDHWDHDTLNNTDSNLRIVTRAENMQNLKGASTNSKSGILGVSWHSRDKIWRAKICVNRVVTLIGYFKDINDAEQAVIEARMKYMPYSQDAMI